MAEKDDEKTTDREKMAASYQGFDPVAYLQHNYTPPRADFTRTDSVVPWKLGCLHRALTEGDISGEVLVDVGSGPTLYQLLSGCEVFSKVILSDYLDVNRAELKRWLQKEECGLDWTPFLQYVCKLEGRVGPSAVAEKAARLRAVVSDVLHVDVLEPQPLGPDSPLPPGGADCLLSCFCLESVTYDLDTFTRALGNIGSLLRPGGHILLIGTLEMRFYMGGPGVKIDMFPCTASELCSSLKKTGFNLIRMEVFPFHGDQKAETDDAAGVFFIKARKK